MPSSIEFSPANWHCPKCMCMLVHQHSSDDNPFTILRGTCCHDICSNCIRNLVSRRNLVKQRGAVTTRKSSANNSSLIDISCPIEKCISGKFTVDREKFSSGCGVGIMNQGGGNAGDVIDLCEEVVDVFVAAKRSSSGSGSNNNNSSSSDVTKKRNASTDADAMKRESKCKRSSSDKQEEDGVKPNIAANKARAAHKMEAKDHAKKESTCYQKDEEVKKEEKQGDEPSSSEQDEDRLVDSLKKEEQELAESASRNDNTVSPSPVKSSCNTNTNSKINMPKLISPLPAKNLHNLKPTYEAGAEIYAAWWDPHTDAQRQGIPAWYPGKVKSYHEYDSQYYRYGPRRLYNIVYSDGDELNKLQDYWIFPRKDYELTMRLEDMGWEPIGVTKRNDKTNSGDKWADMVGWYEVKIDGENQQFSLLSDAMKAHDVSVVRMNGWQTKKSYLNMPEDYPWLFSEDGTATTAAGELSDSSFGEGNKIHVICCMSNAGSPPSNSKRDVGADTNGGNGQHDDNNGIANNEDESDDDESRFSKVDEESEHESNARDNGNEGSWRDMKRRRLDLTQGAKIQNTKFWSVNKADIQFTKEAFASKPIFHLNSFVDGKKKKNKAFSLFIREGVATPGFYAVPTTLDIDRIASLTHAQLREALVQGNNNEWGASQTATWLKQASVGSFVVMRHEYVKCKFCPGRLKDQISGKYIGPVYVIGVITKKVVPWSAEERDIADNRMGEFSNHYWDIHNVCRVSWRRMGYKKDLNKATQSYINHVCQPTLVRVCEDFDKVYTGGATSRSIRENLWMNATIPITSNEFADKFDYRKEPVPEGDVNKPRGRYV